MSDKQEAPATYSHATGKPTRAEEIIRTVRAMIAAEHKHAKLIGDAVDTSGVIGTSRDEIDLILADLLRDFTVEDCDTALKFVRRRSPSPETQSVGIDGLEESAFEAARKTYHQTHIGDYGALRAAISAYIQNASRSYETRRALELAEGRLALLLQNYPDESATCDHPVATRYVLGKVRKALGSSPSPQNHVQPADICLWLADLMLDVHLDGRSSQVDPAWTSKDFTQHPAYQRIKAAFTPDANPQLRGLSEDQK